jgi:hypothetical protein
MSFSEWCAIVNIMISAFNITTWFFASRALKRLREAEIDDDPDPGEESHEEKDGPVLRLVA